MVTTSVHSGVMFKYRHVYKKIYKGNSIRENENVVELKGS